MNYEQRIVCFLDILAFKGHIANTVKENGQDHSSRIKEIAEAIKMIPSLLRIEPELEKQGFVLPMTQFSDSIVLSFPETQQSEVYFTLSNLLLLQVNLLNRGFLCRGAIVYGKIIHTNELLFGPAVVEAYDLESSKAIYPRIILDNSIIELGAKAHADHHCEHHEERYIKELLTKDEDGYHYIDYITRAGSELDDVDEYSNYLTKLEEIIETGLLSDDPIVLEKYHWMEKRAKAVLNLKM